MIGRKFLVDAQVWKITDGEPQELKVDDKIFVLKPETSNLPIEPKREKPKLEPKPKPKKHTKHNVKMSYLEKWITKGNFEFFTLEQFFKVFPKQKRNDNLDRNVSGLVDKKIITQLGKDKFRVNRIK